MSEIDKANFFKVSDEERASRHLSTEIQAKQREAIVAIKEIAELNQLADQVTKLSELIDGEKFFAIKDFYINLIQALNEQILIVCNVQFGENEPNSPSNTSIIPALEAVREMVKKPWYKERFGNSSTSTLFLSLSKLYGTSVGLDEDVAHTTVGLAHESTDILIPLNIQNLLEDFKLWDVVERDEEVLGELMNAWQKFSGEMGGINSKEVLSVFLLLQTIQTHNSIRGVLLDPNIKELSDDKSSANDMETTVVIRNLLDNSLARFILSQSIGKYGFATHFLAAHIQYQSWPQRAQRLVEPVVMSTKIGTAKSISLCDASEGRFKQVFNLALGKISVDELLQDEDKNEKISVFSPMREGNSSLIRFILSPDGQRVACLKGSGTWDGLVLRPIMDQHGYVLLPGAIFRPYGDLKAAVDKAFQGGNMNIDFGSASQPDADTGFYLIRAAKVMSRPLDIIADGLRVAQSMGETTNPLDSDEARVMRETVIES